MSIMLDPEQLSRGRTFANSWEPAKLLKVIAKSPRTLETGIIDIEVRPVPEAIRCKEKATEDFGNMRCLPNEVVDLIVHRLDILSAISLSYVNRITNQFVQQSPVSFLRQWAPGMPKILRKTQIHQNWSIHELKEAIIREKCVVCGDASVQLYLPTMERICHPCMHENHAYWCLPVEQAAIIFGLDLPDLINTQTMYLPRLSKNGFDLGELGAWVVPVKLALTKALKLYGTRKGIKRAVEGSPSSSDADEEQDPPDDEEFVVENQHDIYRAAPLNTPNSVKLRLLISMGNYHQHAHHHEVACRVPVVNRDNTRRILYSCRGCTAMLTHPKMESISDNYMRMMGLDPALDKYQRSFAIFRRAFRVWTLAEMIEHIRTDCIGSWFLLHAAD
ncbi:Cyclin-like F-box [Penicillium digitatum]|uniref:F-box domain-containing protein n=3 Tax=Penicillium digitatum TaxID=36651 RepID=K9F4Y6_PEND2|nr:hypothetical protein PDIP_06780 [Penicillium digitatum Pd1]EKV04350.1 hypothetical protein PDIG_89850 [Penicillium digitatum PHI26]EKV21419.1 hypothetical protein PDIP_06780 [Penicillium digitatum Pd1]KAG0154314.1 hypothetical protein PDIDSM_1694 [Penicillium digitatum]QQK47950.1 Cyclin-like F-box [Penicillium digitatum]